MEFKTSADYRHQARMTMSGKYWYMFGVSLLASLITGIGNSVSNLFVSHNSSGVPEPTILGFIISLLALLFVTMPISVGLSRFFVISKRDNADVSELFYPYKNGLMNVALTMLKREIFVMLWSLLFIIPGIVKTFSYFMIDYLLAENPNMSGRRAFEISNQAMIGYRAKAFLLGLSFIGWLFLGMLAFGFGVLLVIPYMQAAYVELYEDIKQSAIDRGIMSADELYSQNVL